MEAEQDAKEVDSVVKSRPKLRLRIPYIGGASVLLAKRMRKLVESVGEMKLQIVYETHKVKDHFKLKCQVEKPLLTKVVYQFVCPGDPDIAYIGYTNRTLNERVSEHRKTCTAVSNHASECSPCKQRGVSIDNFKILKKCRDAYETMVYEALLIKRHNPVLNRNLIKPGKSFTLQLFN